jgi:23S rRNA (adenine2503-C2)-methyltransferase
MMKVVLEKGMDELATIFAAVYRNDNEMILEFVDSLSGSSSIEDKWVIVVSSQFGCPVNCLMCDTSGYFRGNPTALELFQQVEYVVKRRFPDNHVPTKKFKVQFARMGEPSLNPAVLDAIEMIRERITAPGFMPCISTMAPNGSDGFFDRLAEINHESFKGNFQLQFSIHSTDEKQRDRIMPMNKWDLDSISAYGDQFYAGGRKISLNFALAKENSIDVEKLSSTFDPEKFMFKFTPVNPTFQAKTNGMDRGNLLESEVPQIGTLRGMGFDVILSVGDLRENAIGSNCGQLAALWKKVESDSPNTSH